MPLAIYVKNPPKKPRNPKTEKYFYIGISVVGLCALVFSVFPFFAWQLTVLPKISSKVENVPIPNGNVLSSVSAIKQNVKVVKDPDGFSYFMPVNLPPVSGGQSMERPVEFSISVPKLEIFDARVLVDELKFDKNLSHFPGTALPGEAGNSFITGHSVLPQFADTKNYRAIFTKLSSLEIGDDIVVELDGNKFNYIVQYSKVVEPEDLSVLAPISSTGKNLTLMTCVPPGTNIKRLVVVATLI